MKISYNQLKAFIHLDESPEEIGQLLTGCGLEVEAIEVFETIKGGLKGVVVGKVLTCMQHPNADRLRVTTVDIGSDTPLQIVCGAPNVAAGQKVLVATIGTTLYPTEGSSLKIEKSKIRGEVSEGMICAEDELGTGVSHDGILVLPEDTPLGLAASNYFKIENDYIFEIGLTANRGDAASHIGVARDLSALLNRPLINSAIHIEKSSTRPIQIRVENSENCPRYAALIIDGVRITDSPAWLQNLLRSLGLTPINNVVDVTNYILHAVGQPIHAFDRNQIKGDIIVVKDAEPQQMFITLDQVERKLHGSELMIYNELEPMAIAGVFGGLHSGITTNTTSIVLESAYFHPAAIRKTAKLHGLSTDASFRFERGTDPDSVTTALSMAAATIIDIAGGSVASELYDIYPNIIKPFEIEYSLKEMEKLIGQHIPHAEVKQILTHLGISILSESGDILNLQIPPRKSDVTRQADVTEEILRIYGLNQIAFPAQMLSNRSYSVEDDFHRFKNKIADYLSSNGFCEIMTNSLMPLSKLDEPATAVTLLNPLSNELDSLRQNMIHSSLQALVYNRNRQINDLMLYEFGKTYFKAENNKYIEKKRLAIILSGNREPENFESKSKELSYFYLKSVIESLLTITGVTGYQFAIKEHTMLDECGIYTWQQKSVAEIGFLKDGLLQTYGTNGPVLYAELDWNALCKSYIKKQNKYQQVPKFPIVRRDLSLLLDEATTFKQITDLIRQTERKILHDITIFDIYKGDKLPAGKKSYAISLKLQDTERTLNDEIIEKTMRKITERLEKELGANIR